MNDNKAKPNELELAKIHFEIDIANQKQDIPLFSIALQNPQLLLSLGSIDQFSWGFQLNVTLNIPGTTMYNPRQKKIPHFPGRP